MVKAVRPGAGMKAGNRRHRVAYNAHVQRDRLNKYYERKKVGAKYRRVQRFEEKQQTGSGGAAQSLLERVMADGPEAVRDDYEQRLAQSFGGGVESTNTSSAEPRKRKKRRRESPRDGAVSAVKDSDPHAAAHDNVVDIAAADATSDSGRKPTRSKKKAAAQKQRAVLTTPTKEQSSKTSKPEKVKSLPSWETGRFARDLKEFQKKQEAEAAERQRIQDEILQRKKQRRESAKGRAIMGQLLTQRTSRGQPKMQSMLEAVTAKLTGEQRHAKPKVSAAAPEKDMSVARGFRNKRTQQSRGW